MDILEFLDNSPSPAWAAETGASLLKASGFVEIKPGEDVTVGKIFVRPHSGMLIAAAVPPKIKANQASFRIIGAHTDSPHLRLKPRAAEEKSGYTVLASEIYGGALLYTWFDRALGLAGEVYFKTGDAITKTLVKIDESIAIVPSLAIHLQRGINEDGFAPAKATALHALISAKQADFDLHEYLAARAHISAEQILSYDLSLFDTQKAVRGGVKNELLSSARLDNLVSCFAALSALRDTKTENTISVVALFDHEEVGSVSESGAESGLTEKLLHAFGRAAGLEGENFAQALARSIFLSADMAHGVHPNFADKHDTENRPRLGDGVTLKVNQNRRYATSAATQAVFHDICQTNQIASQIYTHRNDLPCGSTIGPAVSAALGIPTLDVGVAMLGMHSIRETCAWADLAEYQNFMAAFLAR
ncbi:MAG: M18 family aminopeptidase [Turneriella sp.]|nr:M18 family aminopeptidase [Turneriella sp.]